MRSSAKELNEAVTKIYQVAAGWSALMVVVDAAKLDDDALGAIGSKAGCVSGYNKYVVDAAVARLNDGYKSLVASGDTLNQVIKNYDTTEVVNKDAIIGVQKQLNKD